MMFLLDIEKVLAGSCGGTATGRTKAHKPINQASVIPGPEFFA
jgi:hypothetical protein